MPTYIIRKPQHHILEVFEVVSESGKTYSVKPLEFEGSSSPTTAGGCPRTKSCSSPTASPMS